MKSYFILIIFLVFLAPTNTDAQELFDQQLVINFQKKMPISLAAKYTAFEKKLESSISATPNPFFEETSINFEIVENSLVSIEMYNSIGERLSVLRDQVPFDKGEYSLQWKPEGLAPGYYFCKLKVNDESTILKIVLMN